MKPLQSKSEKLVEGVNYEVRNQTTWKGVEWKSYNATIGSSFFSCTSLGELKQAISNYKFETKKGKLLTDRAIASFGTTA